MSNNSKILFAAKCAPQSSIFRDIEKAGIEAVELFLSGEELDDLYNTVQTCKAFPFRYAVHAPNSGFLTDKLAKLSGDIRAEIAVFQNIYWEDEWQDIITMFNGIETKLCIENIYSIHESSKFMRRYGFSSCLDLEHLQIECAGVFEEEFMRFMKHASHIHLTGYIFGSSLWHTHIHQSVEHCLYMLNLLKKSSYSGMVVSEARVALQTYDEFKKLHDFYQLWISMEV